MDLSQVNVPHSMHVVPFGLPLVTKILGLPRSDSISKTPTNLDFFLPA
jgi:hypothetical protein